MTNSAQADVKVLDDELVASYLKRNPDFFLNQDELLSNLRIPHARGSSISLVERQLAVLRQRGMDLQERLQRMLEVARENDRLFALTRELTLQLLETTSVTELIATLEDSLRQRFQVEYVGLVLFAEQSYDVGRWVRLDEAKKKISSCLGAEPVCGVLRDSELEFLFGGEQAQQVGSVAVASLSYQGLRGVLALGSNDSNRYGNTVDTIFLEYLVQVIGRLLATLPMVDAAKE